MHDVVIAGAGPNGLMLACELSLAGVRPLVLERLPEPTTEHRANGMVGQVVRMLDRRGLHERLAGPLGRPLPRFVFGAMPLDLTLAPDAPLHVLPVPQRRIAAMLTERATELGVEIRHGHELTGLDQHEESVTAEVAGPDGTYSLEARYLVGADGGHSVTRKLAGIGFPGVTEEHSVSRSAHVTVPPEIVDPHTGGLRVPGHGVIPPLSHYRTETGLFVYATLETGTSVTTIEWVADDTGDDTAMTVDELRASVRRVLGADVPLGPPEGDGPHLARRLHGRNTRLAERFRDGRVLLVGDAAHVHSAIGGPGLNLGMQDAIGLGWKLAAQIHGWAPPGLLDTYEAERRPAAERVVMHTQAQSALIGPGRPVTALRELFGELLRLPETVRHIANTMSGADIRYTAATAHPLDGRWAPDLVLEDGRRLAELTRTARPLLLDFTGTLGDDVRGWADRVDLVTGKAEADATALLIRPDGYVAWASSSAAPDDTERKSLRSALERWFGLPLDA
ncbi:FAD-dependent monooxygenase [Amycolatopsis australiensis]|uniref:2-polyprenyl-6-methoxyphenol hydroxylase n=1 Tax=Amycolatopsis australiensis TaxID=546364 RepID=A0A1K1SDY3_9PSEU|nr:FAD-dependent monooxygenase [Amycolatopsis australiensis]SFW82593.1 2-polyprenyl-6-methoxyphenol hydroxylase [Amycolatopsis australiensis]